MIADSDVNDELQSIDNDKELGVENLLEDNAKLMKVSPKNLLVSYENVACKRPTWNGKILYDINYSGRARNFKKNVSKIWMHGGYEENEDSTINTDFFRCGECGWKAKFNAGSTSSIRKHLANTHMIDCN